MGALIVIAVILLPLLSAFAAWSQADEVGIVIAAVPIPFLILLFSIASGIYMMNTEDGTDMRHISGFIGLVAGIFLAALTFGLGCLAGHLKVRKLRRP
jgi:hypothetical protein